MTSIRNIPQSTRRFLMASATGVALCSTSLVAQADFPFRSGAVPPAPQGSSEPAKLSVNGAARPLANPPRPLSLTAGEATASPQSDVQRELQRLYEQDGRPVPAMPGIGFASSATPASSSSPAQPARNPVGVSQPQTNSPAPKKETQVGFFDRVSRVFKSSRSNTPPVDPGMTYPKSSQQGPPPAPGVTTSPPIAPPPVAGTQPGIFQPPISANPIHHPANLIPPAPGDENSASAPSGQQILALPAPGGQSATNLPELKHIMENPTAAAPAAAPSPTATAGTPGLPVLDFNAPLPESAARIAPGEPTEQKTAEVPAAPAGQPNDPFADLFPDDSRTATNSESEKMVDEPVTQPYTGLTLEENASPMGQRAGQPGGSPPPNEGLTPPDSGKPMLQLKAPVAETATNTAPAADGSGEKPRLDLSLPQNLPALSSSNLPSLKLTPELPPQTPAPPAGKTEVSDEQRSKLEKIAARKDQKGLKGFCPVVLRDQRDLVDASEEFSVVYNGKSYHFSSTQAMAQFLEEPAKYAPAASGCDVIHLALTGEELEGSLDHAVWYKGRLYLFTSVETMDTFVAAPSSHAAKD